MELNWFSSVIYGFLSGLTDILPVSAQAHRVLLLKFFGVREAGDVMDLLIHLGMFVALYYSSQAQFIRMNRARALARIPKKKRKRPLDLRSMMDWSLLKTMVVPGLLGIFCYQYVQKIQSNFLMIALFLFINGVILYVPQFLPTSNRDSRTLSRVEGLLMGLGGAVSVLPGMSAVGVATSIGSVCGVERTYGLNMVLMMNTFLSAGMIIYDIIGIIGSGVGTLSFLILVRYLITAVAAFAGTMLGIKLIRQIVSQYGFSKFGIYCWGMSLFIFILNLMA